jgi:hypothetical protein
MGYTAASTAGHREPPVARMIGHGAAVRIDKRKTARSGPLPCPQLLR